MSDLLVILLSLGVVFALASLLLGLRGLVTGRGDRRRALLLILVALTLAWNVYNFSAIAVRSAPGAAGTADDTQNGRRP